MAARLSVLLGVRLSPYQVLLARQPPLFGTAHPREKTPAALRVMENARASPGCETV